MTTFTKGDRVRFNQKYGFNYIGDEGTVLRLHTDGLLEIKMDRGHSAGCYGYRVDKIEAKPKFAVGQRVVPKQGYSYASHKDKPLVVLVIEHGVYGVGLVGNDASLSHNSKGWYAYNESALEPYAPTFKVGDYVEVWGYEVPSEEAKWEGRKGEVTHISVTGTTVVVEFGDTEDYWLKKGGFIPSVLRMAATPTLLEKAGLKIGDKVRWTGVNPNLSETFRRNGGTVSGSVYNLIAVDVVGKGNGLLYSATELELGKPTLLQKHGFKVGDKVRPSGVSPHMTGGSFADQGGTIAEDQENGSIYIRVIVGDNTAIYLPKEIELGEVEPKPSFKVGDWVEQQGYGSGYDGTQGEVTTVRGSLGWTSIKTAEGYALGFPPEFLTVVERPAPFKVGDYVEVHGRGDKWDGTQGEVTSVEAKSIGYHFHTIQNADGLDLQFDARKLKKIKRPLVTFKVGDFVEVTSEQGHKGQQAEIVSIGAYPHTTYYRLRLDDFLVSFTVNELKKAERPVKKTWAELADIKDVFVTKYGDKVTRFLTKTGENAWTVQYPDTHTAYSDWKNTDVDYYDAVKV